MTSHSFDDTGGLPRRAVLATLGVGLTGGCIRTIESAVGRDTPKQLSLSVKTLPADADPRATRIARTLVTNLKHVGIDAKVIPMSREELFRDILLNQSFDIYVAQHPESVEPDFLRPLTHSKFDVESGWQNPFGYADLELDDMLTRQTTQAGPNRTRTLARIQKKIVRNQPFSVVAFPEKIHATRDTRFDIREDLTVHSLPWYLSVSPSEGETIPETSPTPNATTTTTSTDTSEPRPTLLRMTISDVRPTENLNPLAVEFRTPDSITSLLYDPLGRKFDDTFIPWLAESWEFTTDGTGGLVCDLTLREDLRWHDEQSLTADDVVFTYKFLQDTALGNFSMPVPAPRFRGPTSLVEHIEAESDRHVRIEFGSIDVSVAEYAFTVPILPEHVWRDKSRKASVAGLNTASSVTQALVWGNPNPVGSGPFRFRSSEVKQSVTFDAYEDHFLTRNAVSGLAGQFTALSIDQVKFLLVPSSGSAIELLQRGEADATASSLLPDEIPTIGRSDELSLEVTRSGQFYHVGYNVRRAPLGNPRFRRAVARLLDKAYLVDDVFKGYATPAASPLAGSGLVPKALHWKQEDPELPFAGSNGRLDVEAARESFREAGYRYTEDGRLLSG